MQNVLATEMVLICLDWDLKSMVCFIAETFYVRLIAFDFESVLMSLDLYFQEF